MYKVAHMNAPIVKVSNGLGWVRFEPGLSRLAFSLGKLLASSSSSSYTLAEVKRRISRLDPPKFKLVLSGIKMSWMLEVLPFWCWSGGWFLYLRTRIDRTWSVNYCRLFKQLACTLRASVDRPVRTHVVWRRSKLSGTAQRYEGKWSPHSGLKVLRCVNLELFCWNYHDRWSLSRG